MILEVRDLHAGYGRGRILHGVSFGIDKGAISRQIQHLDDLGLVTRAPDPDDGRATLVAASDDAVRRMADVARQPRERGVEHQEAEHRRPRPHSELAARAAWS